MKLIFSRKGCDSASGEMASPILSGDSLCWLPIPDKDGNIRYSDIHHDASNIGEVITKLSCGKISADATAHLDPDIWPDSICHAAEWRPVFGQCGAAQGHLENQGVQIGDIFFFYGWFRQTESRDRHLTFQKNDSGRHILFAWMQIGEIIPVKEKKRIPAWADHHPHVVRASKFENDTLYIASEKLVINGKEANRAGYGCFSKISAERILTWPGTSRSAWKLPQWFFPFENNRKPLTYHSCENRWTKDQDCVRLQTVGRGQEFVLDCGDYPEAIDWLIGLIG